MNCNHDCNNCNEDCQERQTSLLVKPNKHSSVKNIIGIVSGKGGVGKSLVTSLLAVSLNKSGYSVGILDADITGPSIPKTFGINQPLEGNEFGTFPNKSKKGIQIVSTNLLLENETDPVVWRGPVIANLVQQFWKDVIWKDIDFLLVDMPPGTSDVPLTVFQSLPISGVIVVTTPQDLVGMIVEKALKMANMMNIPVLGIVENMSYFTCPDCGKHIEVFGHSSVDKVAQENKIKVLGKLPIDPTLTSLIDAGKIEDYQGDDLNEAVKTLEQMPVRILNVALPVNDDETINHHFGHCKTFILYMTINQMVISKHMLKIEKIGHQNVVDALKKYQVHTVLGSHAGDEALEALANADIEYIFGLEGLADEIILKYLYNELDDEVHDGHCSCDHADNCDGNCDGGCGCCH